MVQALRRTCRLRVAQCRKPCSTGETAPRIARKRWAATSNTECGNDRDTKSPPGVERQGLIPTVICIDLHGPNLACRLI